MTTVVHPGDSLSRGRRIAYVLVLGALTGLGPFTVDMYLPAFPVLERELAAPTALVQVTLTATTLGFALGQLIVGPLSDRVGRRIPLLAATTLHIAASLCAAIAPDIGWLIVFRLLMGFGAAAGGVVTMAIVRDLFGGYSLVRMLSRLALVTGFAPVLAPVIGSQLLGVMPWRGLFDVLAGYGVVVTVTAAFLIRETLPRARRHETGHTTLGQRYRALFRDRVYVGILLVAGMNFSGLFAYLSSSPFLFQDVYGFDAQQYGILFGINSLGVIVGVQTASRLARRVPPQWIMACSTIVQLAMALTILVLALAGAGLWGVLIPLWFFICATAFNFPCTQVLALAQHGKEAGTAASLLGAVNFGLSGLIGPIVGLFRIENAIPMSIVMAAAVSLGIIVLWTVVRPRTVPALGD